MLPTQLMTDSMVWTCLFEDKQDKHFNGLLCSLFSYLLLLSILLCPSLSNVNQPCLCPMWEGSSKGTSREAWGISRSPRENSFSRLKRAWVVRCGTVAAGKFWMWIKHNNTLNWLKWCRNWWNNPVITVKWVDGRHQNHASQQVWGSRDGSS